MLDELLQRGTGVGAPPRARPAPRPPPSVPESDRDKRVEDETTREAPQVQIAVHADGPLPALVEARARLGADVIEIRGRGQAASVGDCQGVEQRHDDGDVIGRPCPLCRAAGIAPSGRGWFRARWGEQNRRASH
jgi:hypothetical protein